MNLQNLFFFYKSTRKYWYSFVCKSPCIEIVWSCTKLICGWPLEKRNISLHGTDTQEKLSDSKVLMHVKLSQPEVAGI